ncbi:hypothetical protein ACHQM5_023518 [Ranunculus cassubicifolius]
MSSSTPHRWSYWLPLAEWWYNTSHHTATRISLFLALYGYKTPIHSFPQHPSSTCSDVNALLKERAHTFSLIKEHLQQAKDRMKLYANRKRTERSFGVGALVYLRLQPYRQNSVVIRRNLKLSPRFFGPYRVLEKIGGAAYKLELPAGSLIHPIFHVSQLKEVVGVAVPTSVQLPQTDQAGHIQVQPVAILDRCSVRRREGSVSQVLVQWSKHHPADTWEEEKDICARFPFLCT